jgi:hypothetical protein
VQSERGGTWPWDGGERVHVAPTHPIRDAVVDIGSALTLREAIVEGAEAKPFCLAHLHLRGSRAAGSCGGPVPEASVPEPECPPVRTVSTRGSAPLATGRAANGQETMVEKRPICTAGSAVASVLHLHLPMVGVKEQAEVADQAARQSPRGFFLTSQRPRRPPHAHRKSRGGVGAAHSMQQSE